MLLFPLYATKYFLVRILLCNKQKYPIKRNIYHDVNGKWFSTGKIHELKQNMQLSIIWLSGADYIKINH
jgi:hypothetical protein